MIEDGELSTENEIQDLEMSTLSKCSENVQKRTQFKEWVEILIRRLVCVRTKRPHNTELWTGTSPNGASEEGPLLSFIQKADLFLPSFFFLI